MSKYFIRHDGKDYCVLESVDEIDGVDWITFTDHNEEEHALPAIQFYTEYCSI